MDRLYQVAMAAGQDAGNRQMFSQGREKWNESDWNLAAKVVAEVLGR